MRFVPIKTPEQQSGLVLHRTQHLLIRHQTAVINAIRAHLAEFGIVAPVGRKGVEELLRVVADGNDKRVPEVVRACLGTGYSIAQPQEADFGTRSNDHGLVPV
jgi:transposase